MDNRLSKDAIQYIIARVLDNAKDALSEAENNKGDLFYEGKKLAYYEVLDTVKNELEVRDQDLSEYGLDFDLDNMDFGTRKEA